MIVNIFENVFTLSLMSSAVIIIIALFKKVFGERMSPGWHYYIWFLLLVRLVIPYTPQFHVQDVKSLINCFKPAESTFNENIKLKNAQDAGQKQLMANTGSKGGELSAEAYKSAAEKIIPKIDFGSDKFSYLELGGSIWLGGTILTAGYMLTIYLILCVRIRKKKTAGENSSIAAEIFSDCKKITRTGCRIPLIYQNSIKTPAMFGFIRPKLLVPENLMKKLNQEQIKCIFIHELCHFKRGDTLLNLLQMGLSCLHWFNPLIWYAFRKMREDREAACDSLVLTYLKPGERIVYAGTLLKILEVFSKNNEILSTVGIFNGSYNDMERRLKFMKSFKKRSLLAGVTVTAVTIILSVIVVLAIRGNISLPVYSSVKTSVQVPGGTPLPRGRIFDRNGTELVGRDGSGKRVRLYNNLALQVLGLEEKGKGITGIELFMDKNGLAKNNVNLTIDKNIQEIAEKALDKAVKDYKLRYGASAIIIDPSSGEILAMAQRPEINPAESKKVASTPDTGNLKAGTGSIPSGMLNKNISITYEPGSTFKAVTSAAGLEENVINPNSPVTDEAVRVDRWNINCWRPNYHGKETFTQGLYNSCNPVFVRIAQKLGTGKFYSYVRKFGFYDRTGIELPDESESIIHKKPTEVNMATAAFGQRFQVTPLQLAMAYGAIANGGSLLKPHIIKDVTDYEGRLVMRFSKEKVRKAISQKTSETLRGLLEGVVSDGTGGNAYVKGYRIAGATGTSETLETRKTGRYIASFAGFAPAGKPEIACVLLLDGPNVYPHTGGMLAAPIFGRLIKDVLDYKSK